MVTRHRVELARIVAAMEAAGTEMFGISTALIFAVIQRLIQARLEAAEHIS